MPEVLHTEVVGARPLRAPAPSFDAVTRAALEAATAEAEARGRAAGEAAGRAAARAELADAADAVVGAVTALHAEVVAQREAALARDLDRVTAVVTAVLGQAPPATAALLAARLRDAVALLDDAALPVRLHPDDAAALADVLDDPRVTLRPDPTIARGDALIEGGWGRAELTRAAITRAVLDTLAEDERRLLDATAVPGGPAAAPATEVER